MLFFTFYRLGILELKEALEFIELNTYLASPGISCYIVDKCLLSL